MWPFVGSLIGLAIFVFLYFGIRATVQEWLHLERNNKLDGDY